jgi:hypothetical protein
VRLPGDRSGRPPAPLSYLSLRAGFVDLCPEKRKKSRSVVQRRAPCSSAIAARTASLTSAMRRTFELLAGPFVRVALVRQARYHIKGPQDLARLGLAAKGALEDRNYLARTIDVAEGAVDSEPKVAVAAR